MITYFGLEELLYLSGYVLTLVFAFATDSIEVHSNPLELAISSSKLCKFFSIFCFLDSNVFTSFLRFSNAGESLSAIARKLTTLFTVISSFLANLHNFRKYL